MPLCNYVAKTARTRYHHRKFLSARVNFDEEAVGQNWQGRGILVGVLVGFGSLFGSVHSFFGSIEYVQNFRSTLLGSNFKK
jgi:hypothetical protein